MSTSRDDRLTHAQLPKASRLLSVLIFSPLAAAVVAAFLRSERLLRWWTLAFTSAIALFSLPLYWRFDATTADFQFAERVHWIPCAEASTTPSALTASACCWSC